MKKLILLAIIFVIFGCQTAKQPKDIEELLVVAEATPAGYKAIDWDQLIETECVVQCFDRACFDFDKSECGKILLEKIK